MVRTGYGLLVVRFLGAPFVVLLGGAFLGGAFLGGAFLAGAAAEVFGTAALRLFGGEVPGVFFFLLPVALLSRAEDRWSTKWERDG